MVACTAAACTLLLTQRFVSTYWDPKQEEFRIQTDVPNFERWLNEEDPDPAYIFIGEEVDRTMDPWRAGDLRNALALMTSQARSVLNFYKSQGMPAGPDIMALVKWLLSDGPDGCIIMLRERMDVDVRRRRRNSNRCKRNISQVESA